MSSPTAATAAHTGLPGRRPGPAERRVCVVGDDLVAGIGDPKSLGWVGRVGARTSRAGGSISIFPLGVPVETTAGLLRRWSGETALRFAGAAAADCRLVVGLGHEDVRAGVSMARSRLNLANLLDDCTARPLPVFVVGPPPAPQRADNPKVAELSAAFADVCVRRGVTYVDCFTPLESHDDWLTDIAAGDGVHPGQAGYGLMAWLVLHSSWHEFLGVPEPTP